MKKFDITISVIGRIASGKTTVSNFISNKFNIPIISFGSVIKSYCISNNIEVSRETMQDTGQRLINANPKKFLKMVLNFTRVSMNKVIIFDGVRHKVIFEMIKELSTNGIGIFVEAQFETRYQRYIEQNNLDNNFKTIEEFKKINLHKVEQEIDLLKPTSDIIVNTNIDYTKELTICLNKLL